MCLCFCKGDTVTHAPSTKLRRRRKEYAVSYQKKPPLGPEASPATRKHARALLCVSIESPERQYFLKYLGSLKLSRSILDSECGAEKGNNVLISSPNLPIAAVRTPPQRSAGGSWAACAPPSGEFCDLPALAFWPQPSFHVPELAETLLLQRSASRRPLKVATLPKLTGRSGTVVEYRERFWKTPVTATPAARVLAA